MRFQIKRVVLIITFLLIAFSINAGSLSPVGYWDQYSDKSHQLQSIIQIWQQGDELKGRVIKGFPVNGKAPNHYCTTCSGNFKNKRIIDLTIVWGLKYDSQTGKWIGGHILDPESGHIYQLKAALSNDGEQLTIRAYLGVSLLGRSQTWTRITETTMQQQLTEIKKVIGNQ